MLTSVKQYLPQDDTSSPGQSSDSPQQLAEDIEQIFVQHYQATQGKHRSGAEHRTITLHGDEPYGL